MIGMIAAILTTVSFVPQAYAVIKTRDVKGISKSMYIMFTIGVLLWFIHGIIIKDYAVIFANGITLIFAVIILSYKIAIEKGDSNK